MVRSIFRSPNTKSTPCSERFWKLRCGKSAWRCGAKHISKSKSAKHTTFQTLLEIELVKNCTPLWREAHFKVKMLKHHMTGPLLECEMPLQREAAVARSTCQQKNVKNTPRSDYFWTFKCRFVWQAQWVLHLAKGEQNTRVL